MKKQALLVLLDKEISRIARLREEVMISQDVSDDVLRLFCVMAESRITELGHCIQIVERKK